MTDSTVGKPNLFDTRRFTGPAQGDQIISVGFSSDVPLCDFCAGGPASTAPRCGPMPWPD